VIKVVNVSDQPVSPIFDSNYYPVMVPGDIAEYEDDVAKFIIRKSAIFDELGDVIGYRLEPLETVLGNADMRANVSLFQCPLILTRECNAPNFRTLDELVSHMDTHKAAPKTGKQSAFKGV